MLLREFLHPNCIVKECNFSIISFPLFGTKETVVPPPPPFNFTRPKSAQQNDTVVIDDNLDRNPFADWFQNIFGRPSSTPEPPVLLDPPEHCDECSEYSIMFSLLNSMVYLRFLKISRMRRDQQKASNCWWCGNKSESVPMDGPTDIRKSFLLWWFIDQRSICFNSSPLRQWFQ